MEPQRAASGTLDAFSAGALDLYRQSWNVPERIHASCEDYRAGAGPDRAADEADLAEGRRLAGPLLVLVADRFVGRNGLDPVRQAWTGTFAPDDTTFEIVPSGHFVAEENPQATLAILERFLAA